VLYCVLCVAVVLLLLLSCSSQPYGCSVVRFSNESLVSRESSCKHLDCAPPYTAGWAVPFCRPPCPVNLTLRYDHCKFFPEDVKIDELKAQVESTPICNNSVAQSKTQDCIDDPNANLFKTRAYLFRGALDDGYREGSVGNAAALFGRYIPKEQILLHNTMKIGHATPMLWMCRGNLWYDGRPMDQAVGHQHGHCPGPPTDGAGECLRWVWGEETEVREPYYWNKWYQTKIPTDWLSQYHLHTRFEISSEDAKLDGRSLEFYMHIPRDCRKGFSCRVHIVLYGCHDAPHNPLSHAYWGGLAPKDSRLLTSNFHVWAASNRIVVVYPISPFNPRQGTENEHLGATGDKACWDGYGDAGENFATQGGLHIRQIRRTLELAMRT